MSKTSAIYVAAFLLLAPQAFADDSHHTSDPNSTSTTETDQPLMGGAMIPGMMPMPMMKMMSEFMAPEHVEGRIAFLRTELGISDQQKAQWETFASALRTMSAHHQRSTDMMKGGTPGMTGSVIDRIGQKESALKQNLEEIQHLRSALEPLYSTLSDPQKKIADGLFMLCPMCGM